MDLNPRGWSINSASIGGYQLPVWGQFGSCRGQQYVHPRLWQPSLSWHAYPVKECSVANTHTHTHTHTPCADLPHDVDWCVTRNKRGKFGVFSSDQRLREADFFKPSVAFKWFNTSKSCFTGCMFTYLSINATHKIPFYVRNQSLQGVLESSNDKCIDRITISNLSIGKFQPLKHWDFSILYPSKLTDLWNLNWQNKIFKDIMKLIFTI